jgi:RDD family
VVARLARSAPGVTIAVARRNDRSPGAYAMGLRRVSSRTGAPLTLRSALIRESTSSVLNQLSVSAVGRASGARSRDVPREDDVFTIDLSTCGLAILAFVVVHVIPICLPPRHQTIPDRVARIVVVEEQRQA